MGEKVEIYNFPKDEATTRMLFWMGNDYIEYIVEALLAGLRKRDAETRLIAIKCEEKPNLTSVLKENLNAETRVITQMEASFKLQILVEDSPRNCWRLFMKAIYKAENLDFPPAFFVNSDFTLIKTESVAI